MLSEYVLPSFIIEPQPIDGEFDITSFGELQEQLGHGLHTEVYKFQPYDTHRFRPDIEWVAKIPSSLVQVLRKYGGYTYGTELRRSYDILVDHASNVGLHFAESQLIGHPEKPVVVQEYIEGRHPKIGDHDFSDVLDIIMEINRKLYRETGAAIDMFNFMRNYLFDGPQKDLAIDNIRINANSEIVLVDTELTKIWSDDGIHAKMFKSSLLNITDYFFKTQRKKFL